MLRSAIVLTFSLVALPALGQTAEAPIADGVTQDSFAPTEKGKEGWTQHLKVGFTGAWNHSNSVIGQTDGSTYQLGLIGDGSLNYRTGRTKWENTLKLNETQTRTPEFERFVKSADELSFNSLAMHGIESLPWVGPYGQVTMSTQVLDGYAYRNAPTTIRRVQRDGEVVEKDKGANSPIRLTKPFEPILLRESVGAFAQALEEKPVNLLIKLGAGAQHVFVRNGSTVTDNADTPELEIVQMQDSTQMGAALELNGKGELAEGVSWEGRAYFFYPVYTSVDTGALEGVDLVSTELSAKVSARLSEWASLDYVVTAKKLPLILDEWQVQNGIILTAGFDLL